MNIFIHTDEGEVLLIIKNNQMRSIIDHLQKDGFTAYAVGNHKGTMQYGGRDDYHKVALISGVGEIKYDHHVFSINGSVLLMTKPGISCTWSLLSTTRVAYICAFKVEFFNTDCIRLNQNCDDRLSLHLVFNLSVEQEKFVRAIFCRMIDDQKIAYAFKGELMQNQLCVLTHMALRMAPSKKTAYSCSSTKPTAAVFLELIEIGFPVIGQMLHFN